MSEINHERVELTENERAGLTTGVKSIGPRSERDARLHRGLALMDEMDLQPTRYKYAGNPGDPPFMWTIVSRARRMLYASGPTLRDALEELGRGDGVGTPITEASTA